MKHLFCILIIAIAATADQKSPAILLKEGNDQFTTRMSSEVSKQHSGESFVLSGISALFPLAVFCMASNGVTRNEILTAMGLPNDNVTKEAFSGFQQNFKSSKGITLDLANKIFVAENYELNDEFAKLSKDVFDTEVQNIDFAQSSKSASIINKWVENHTNNKIKDLISPDTLDSDTKSVLVNAIYFKGNWKKKFLDENTKPHDFYVSKVKKVQVPMMYREGDFLYGESEELNAQLLEIPYENDEASFMVILPNDVEGLPELQRKLSNITLMRNAESHMYSTEVSLYLPKFKIETTTNLIRALENMNVKSLFSNEAGITNLLKSKLPLSVTSAVQKAFIEINEEGTEAAAGSAFGVQYLSAIISKTPTFKADHPFIFFLKEGENIVFTGIYNS